MSTVKSVLCPLMLGAMLLSAGCVKPNDCEIFEPLLLNTEEDVDALYELDPQFADAVLAHNMTGERVCDWAP